VEPPRVLELSSTGCELLTIRWTAPPDLTPSQVEQYSLVISQGVRNGGPVASNITLRGADTYAAAALLSATMYGAELRATNLLGHSRWSERLVATTPAPSRAPVRPPAPVVETNERTCQVRITIVLPTAARKLKPDEECAGAEHVELQTLAAGSTDWRTLASETTAASLTVSAPNDIPAGVAHRFRLVLSNRAGVSPPGVASEAVFGGLPVTAALLPPVVRPTSSASFAVLLPTSPASCLESLAWTVLARLEPHGWQVLGTGTQGSTFAVEQLRCPKLGCEFKLRADVGTFAGALETQSLVVHNAKLPELMPDEVRVELRLRGVEWNSLLRAHFRTRLAALLRQREEPEVLEAYVNVHESSTSVVLDLSGPRSDQVAQRLADLISEGGLGESGSVLTRVQRNAGVLRQTTGGDWMPVLPQPPAKDAFSWQAVYSCAVLFVTVLCIRCVRTMLAAWRRRRELAGLQPLAVCEEDAEEAEEEEEKRSQPPARTVDLNRLVADDDFPA